MNFYEYKNYLASVLHEASPAKSATIKSAGTKMAQRVDQGQDIDDPALQMAPQVASQQVQEVPAQDPTMVQDPSMMDPNMVDPEAEAAIGMDDASYMGMEPPEPTIDDITQQQQKVKLFDNFNELLNLAEYAKNSFTEKLTLDLLDQKKFDILAFSIKKFDGVIQKIKDYQLNSFLIREYEESLYVYMLLRSELLTTIAYIRKALHLKHVPRIADEENKR